MKKFFPIFLSVLLIISYLTYKVSLNKSKDISYVVEHYMTSGIFTRHKLINVDSLHITYSDNNISLVEVTGKEKRPPNPNIRYKVLLEKNKKGLWNVKKIYTQ